MQTEYILVGAVLTIRACSTPKSGRSKITPTLPLEVPQRRPDLCRLNPHQPVTSSYLSFFFLSILTCLRKWEFFLNKKILYSNIFKKTWLNILINLKKVFKQENVVLTDHTEFQSANYLPWVLPEGWRKVSEWWYRPLIFALGKV